MKRSASAERKTQETDVQVTLDLDGNGNSVIKSGNGFFDHALTLFARHGLFNLGLTCVGDTEIDFHHSTEDVGITLGTAFHQAIGDGRGIQRYSHVYVPMDETLVRVVVDICGRNNLVYEETLRDRNINNFEVDLVYDFLKGFCDYARITLHVDILRARNSHHAIEAIFKGLGRALRQASAIDTRSAEQVPSTKGVL